LKVLIAICSRRYTCIIITWPFRKWRVIIANSNIF
jgi:hypothetical protein